MVLGGLGRMDFCQMDGLFRVWSRRTTTPINNSAKRYFYMHKESGKMQWQYPDGSKSQPFQESSSNTLSSTEKAKDTNDTSIQRKRKIEELKKSDLESKRSRSLSPTVTRNIKITDLKPSLTSDSAKDAKPDSNSQYQGVNFQYSDYQQNYAAYTNYMMMRGQQMMYPNSSTPPPPPGGDSSLPPPPPLPEEQPPPSPPSAPPLPPSDEIEAEGEDKDEEDGGIVMEMSDGEDEREDTSTAFMSQQPILYKASGQPLTNVHSYFSSTTTTQSMNSSSQDLMKSAKFVSKVKSKTNKKSKKSGVAKKPPKEMTSLVAQWQKAKQQIEEEDRMLEEDEEEQLDSKEVAKRQIEKWKQQQIASGKASNNANFEPVPEDWRTRILKKKKATKK